MQLMWVNTMRWWLNLIGDQVVPPLDQLDKWFILDGWSSRWTSGPPIRFQHLLVDYDYLMLSNEKSMSTMRNDPFLHPIRFDQLQFLPTPISIALPLLQRDNHFLFLLESRNKNWYYLCILEEMWFQRWRFLRYPIYKIQSTTVTQISLPFLILQHGEAMLDCWLHLSVVRSDLWQDWACQPFLFSSSNRIFSQYYWIQFQQSCWWIPCWLLNSMTENSRLLNWAY